MPLSIFAVLFMALIAPTGLLATLQDIVKPVAMLASHPNIELQFTLLQYQNRPQLPHFNSRERFLRNDFLGITRQIRNGVHIWTGARISSLSFSSPFPSPAPAILQRLPFSSDYHSPAPTILRATFLWPPLSSSPYLLVSVFLWYQ